MLASSFKGDFVLLRLNPDGSLDASFGVDGKLTLDTPYAQETVRQVAVQQDGKILLAGETTAGFGLDLVLLRINPSIDQARLVYDPNQQFEALGPGEWASEVLSYTLSNDWLTSTGSVTITILGRAEPVTADLAISKTLEQDGQFITYTLAVSNLGSEAVDGVRLYDAVSTAIDPLQWACSAGGGAACPPLTSTLHTLDVTLPLLPLGGVVTVTASGVLSPTLDTSNVAWIILPQIVTDPEMGNNHAAVGQPFHLWLAVIAKPAQ